MRKKINILIVDHSRLFRTMLADVLRRHGCASLSCPTGAEALMQLQIQQYDLICAAYHLSDMSGEAFCQKVREIHDCQDTRIILFTAENNESLLKQALLAGATDIYSKRQFALFDIYLQRLAADVFDNIIGQVLLVEDSSSQLLWLEAMLNDRGLEVDAFANAEQALAAFHENAYDLVITDIVLEGSMSGLGMVREIRRDPTDKGLTPVFAISAYDDISRRIELYHAGVNDYMTKPIIAKELLYRAANLIRNQRMVNELNAERRHLQKIALLDSVTGLYNRNAFEKLAPKELAAAERSHSPISLAILDIDYFKRINDSYGHDTGDKALADVGFWLRNTMRKSDLVFRWGGEEFAIILTDCPPDKAVEIMQHQRVRFNKRKYADLTLTASIGISGTTDAAGNITLKQLFKQADEALHNAKASGRDRVCLC